MASADRTAVAQQEIRALQADAALLRAGTADDSASTSAEREAAIRSRQQRIDELQNGALPRALQSPRAAGSVRVRLSQEQIRDIFDFYANFGRTQAQTFQDSLDSFMFMKMVKECPGLLDENVNRTEVDLIFTKAKPKKERRLDFSHFLDALAAIAERKFPEYLPADALRLLITEHLAPLYEQYLQELQKTGETEVPLSGVFKKLYDVRSYTGVYAERFRSADGRINGEADNRPGRVFSGSTNTGTDETIHDISVLMRPNLRGGSMMTSHWATTGAAAAATGACPAPPASVLYLFSHARTHTRIPRNFFSTPSCRQRSQPQRQRGTQRLAISGPGWLCVARRRVPQRLSPQPKIVGVGAPHPHPSFIKKKKFTCLHAHEGWKICTEYAHRAQKRKEVFTPAGAGAQRSACRWRRWPCRC